MNNTVSGFDANFDDIIRGLNSEAINTNNQLEEDKLRAILEQTFISPFDTFNKPVDVLTMGNTDIMSLGDFSVITGKAKCRS